ncbi:MAG: hypothetical protein RQ875_13705 [Vicingaceae bacterium]|nr:hypothetical protein [Vicingaceae bacterium]
MILFSLTYYFFKKLKYHFILLFCCIVIFKSSLIAQEQNEKLFRFGAETSSFISYSGINWGVQFNIFHKKHTLGIGTKVSFQSSYFPHNNSLGLIVDYKYFILENKKIKSFININYSNVRYKVKTRFGENNNMLHEFFISNGYLINMFNSFWIGNSIGFGGYLERFYDFSEETHSSLNGYNMKLKIIISYEF